MWVWEEGEMNKKNWTEMPLSVNRIAFTRHSGPVSISSGAPFLEKKCFRHIWRQD